ncbi:hypothetical protein [Okeania sp. SIO3I5]|nr:hypothetical protein [Okeania sp. SIO3I5]
MIQNLEIYGTEYQQGELAGYELREYLLEVRGSNLRFHKWQN